MPRTLAVIMPLAHVRGGAELALCQLVQRSPRDTVRWVVIFLENGPMVTQFQALGVQTEVVPAGRLRQPHRMIAAIMHIARIIRRSGAEAAISWMAKPHLYGAPAAAVARVPAIWFQHGAPDPSAWIDRITARLPARGILTCSQNVAAAQMSLSSARPCKVVHPGVELDRFDPDRLPDPGAARARLGLPTEGRLIGIVGRLQRWKGCHILVAAMPRILASHPDVRAVIVGGTHDLEPEYPAFLEKCIDDLGLQDRVLRVGLQRDVPLWMQSMDVVVHASDREPFGMVVIEAMALGKPVVAGADGGPREIITPGLDGLLAPFGDSESLAAAVIRYLDDPGFAATTGAAARRRAQQFSSDLFAQNVLKAVADLLGEAAIVETEVAPLGAQTNAV